MTKKPLKSFIVDRNLWYRGKGTDNSALLLKRSNKMCCLGFLGVACGMENKDLRGKMDPAHFYNNSTREVENNWPRTLLKIQRTYAFNTALCDNIINVNDDDLISEEEREIKLSRLFDRSGIKIKFKGKRPKNYSKARHSNE